MYGILLESLTKRMTRSPIATSKRRLSAVESFSLTSDLDPSCTESLSRYQLNSNL
ncbi:hypothetical protein BN903_14 [Halorubrum sp. AJ67]|nr:hypothetical protein BN903_14 [Halorubrum sp. AJ67]